MKKDERSHVLGELCRAVSRLERSCAFADLIPEVRTNLAYALPHATTPEEVAGIGGRITIVGGLPRAAGYPSFGASRHLASAILELMKSTRERRAAVNIFYSPRFGRFLERYSEKKSLRCVGVDRSNEPIEARDEEGKSVPWKVQEALRLTNGAPPDVLYETGGFGKEALTLLFAQSPLAVVDLVLPLAQAFAEEA